MYDRGAWFMLSFYDSNLFLEEEVKEAHLSDDDDKKNYLINLYRTMSKEELLERKQKLLKNETKQ